MSLSPGSSSASPSSTTTSRRSYSKKYRSSWEALPECKGWLSKYGEDGGDEKAFCKMCNKVLRPHFGDIKKHAASELHRRKMTSVSAMNNGPYAYNTVAKVTPNLIKFRSEWSEDPALSGWLARSVYGARCKACNVEIPASLADLKRHSSSKRHLDKLSQQRAEAAAVAAAEKAEIKPWQMPEIRKRRLELRVAAHAAVNELLSAGTADLCKLLRDHFGVSAFNMSSSECKALVQLVLAPHFKAELRQDLNDVPFCLVLDYAKHMSSERNISVVARYVSKTRRTISSTYLGTISHPGDMALDWADNILSLMSEWELRGDNLVGLVTDGISDICGDREGLVDCLRASCPTAILLHSAYSSLAMVVNSAVKKCLPAELEFVLRESFNWFAMSLERQHKYAKIVRKLGFDMVTSIDKSDDSVDGGDFAGGWRMDGSFNNGFAQYKPLEAISTDSTQWLSIADFIGAFARSFCLLKEHFAQVRDGEGCFMARLLAEAFLDDKLQLYLSVLQPILTELSELKKMFKLNNAEAADKVGVFFVSLGSQILKPEIIYEMSVEELVEQELDADTCLLDVESVNFGADFTAALDDLSLPSAVMHEVKVKAAEFLREIFSLMQKILTNTLAVMKNAEHFSVPNFLRDRLDRSNLIAPFFSHREEDLKAVEEKYRLMKMLDWKNKDCTKAFWLEIHNFGDATGNFPLRVISQSVLKMLCVPIFDIEVERMFNEIFATRQQCLSRMTPDLVEAILHCKYGLARANQRVFEYKPALDMLQM